MQWPGFRVQPCAKLNRRHGLQACHLQATPEQTLQLCTYPRLHLTIRMGLMLMAGKRAANPCHLGEVASSTYHLVTRHTGQKAHSIINRCSPLMVFTKNNYGCMRHRQCPCFQLLLLVCMTCRWLTAIANHAKGPSCLKLLPLLLTSDDPPRCSMNS